MNVAVSRPTVVATLIVLLAAIVAITAYYQLRNGTLQSRLLPVAIVAFTLLSLPYWLVDLRDGTALVYGSAVIVTGVLLGVGTLYYIATNHAG